MRILNIETSSRLGAAALSDGPTVVRERQLTEAMTHGRDLVPVIDSLFRDAGWQPEQIDLVAVSAGPGSYTGLRIGITCAKTIAFFQQKAILGVPSLDVIAENAPPDSPHVCPVVDARRRQVYAGLYAREGEQLTRTTDYLVTSADELAEMLPPGTALLGDGLKTWRDALARAEVTLCDESRWYPRVSALARLAARYHSEGRVDDVLSLTPMYLRPPQVTRRASR